MGAASATARAVGMAVALAVLLCAPAHARAQAGPYPPIENRNFAIDGYQGATFASYRIVGMGGTSLATAEGAASMAATPASLASRPATWNDWFEWDFTAESYAPNLGTDYDNNGVRQDETSSQTLAGDAGLMFYLGDWGVGLSGVYEDRRFELSTPDSPPAELSSTVARLSLARSFLARQLSVGASVTVGSFEIVPIDAEGLPGEALVSVGGTAFDAGVLWRPTGRNLRVGAHVQLPITVRLDDTKCDPNDCGGYILPDRVEFPWSVGAGVAWRRGPTPWNQVVHDDWRDEKSLVLAADLLVTGAVTDGAGIESFLEHQLQPSGRDTVVSLRGGAEYEWVPGWLRVRGGLYWEPGRFEGVGGRAHVTLGFDVRVWSFCFWGDRYRVRLSAAADGAPGYTNVMGSLGFWH